VSKLRTPNLPPLPRAQSPGTSTGASRPAASNDSQLPSVLDGQGEAGDAQGDDGELKTLPGLPFSPSADPGQNLDSLRTKAGHTTAEPSAQGSEPKETEGASAKDDPQGIASDRQLDSAITRSRGGEGDLSEDFDGHAAHTREVEKALNPDQLSSLVVTAASKGGALDVLNNAQEEGFYFRVREDEAQQQASNDDDELKAAVLEARRLLAGVNGIDEIRAGEDDTGGPVILVVAKRGFTQASFDAVPTKVHRFETLVALPYELLPLRRARVR
jgi:hypothetical protein